ncbi:MAG TPA: transposase [Pirellulales bacterium]
MLARVRFGAKTQPVNIAKDFSASHRFSADAPWSLDAIGLLIFEMIVPWLGLKEQKRADAPTWLAGDDTLARKRGLKVFGVGMHHDPILSRRPKAITHWGRSWVVLGVIVRFPLWPARAFCLLNLFRPYLNHDAAARHRGVPRTRLDLAVEMLYSLCRTGPNRRFHVVADAGYGGQSAHNRRPKNCDLTSRLLLTARLYAAPPTRRSGTNGRPRRRGLRLPTPAQMLFRQGGWTPRASPVELNLYGPSDRVRLYETIAHCYSASTTPLRIAAVEAVHGGRARQAFYSTSGTPSAAEVLEAYSLRWSLEVAFHDGKQSLGFVEPPDWSQRAVERAAPMARLLFTLTVLWFVCTGRRDCRQLEPPRYTTKREPSFAHTLGTLRRASRREQMLSWGLRGPGSQQVLELLEDTTHLAA